MKSKIYSTAILGKMNRWEVRDYVHAYYQKNIQGKKVVNTDTGITVMFNKESRVKSAKPLMSKEKAIVLLDILHLIEKSNRINFRNPKPKHVKKYRALGFVNFEIKCFIDGKQRKFKASVMVLPGLKFQYSLEENESPASPL